MSEKSIILGGGCFWCIEAVIQRLGGVISCRPGYSGGSTENPTYQEVCTGETGHAEVVCVVYDEEIISLENILDVFFAVHDPCSLNRQGNDYGTQYRSALYYFKEDEGKVLDYLNEKSKEYAKKIMTEVKPIDTFYEAEKEHIDYYNRNSNASYCQYVIDPKLDKLFKNYSRLVDCALK